jgi:MFS family permease
MLAPNDQAVAKTQYNMRYVWAISLVAALGGLMFGYDFVVISGAESFYERFFPIYTAFDKGWAMSSALVGCLLGAIVSGSLSDKCGRKWLLVFAAFVFVASSIGTALIHSFWAFNLWRIAGGMAIGMASNLSPMYISEISPAAVRGRLVTMNQLLIVIGGLLAQAVNWGVAAGIGGAIDDKAIEQHAARNAAAFDARTIAVELAWQVPDFQRRRLTTDFEKLAARRGGPLDVQAVKRLVAELNADTDRAKDKLDTVTAHDKAVEMAGRGIVSWNVDPGWRWMFGVTALPACFFFLLMFLVPESPRWLVKNGRSNRARQILARIGGPAYADCEVASIEETLVGEIHKVNFRDLLEPRMRKILALGIVLAIAQQFCGLNVILYYAVSIFRDAGENVNSALLNIVYMGTINLIFTIVAIFTVDRLGRRILMLLGAAGLTIILSLIGAGFYCGYSSLFILVLCLATCACFALTYGPVVWVLLSEIFPNRIRGAAMSISVFSLWTACFVMILTSPMLRETLGKAGSFWIYAAICLVVFVFIYFKVPETKGKSLEQIEKELVD